MKHALIVLGLLVGRLALAGAAGGEPSAASELLARLAGTRQAPPGWQLERTHTLSGPEVTAVGQRLGIQIDEILNATFSASGRSVQVNALTCPTADETRRAQSALLRIHGGDSLFVASLGLTVVELAKTDRVTAYRAHYELGLRPARVLYRVAFSAAPLSGGDDALWNSFYQECVDQDGGSAVSRTSEADRAALRQGLRFGGPLRLRAAGQGAIATRFELHPAPDDSLPEASGDIVAYSFERLPLRCGVPGADVVATVSSLAFAATPTSRTPESDLLGATESWPSDDSTIVRLASSIVGDRTAPLDKVEALLEWLQPGRNLRYDGAVIGSRHGVRRVIEQGFGRCWDFSDVFITLGRASGVPCRQVAGWLYPREGHVWAEALLPGRGWLQIDPTAGRPCGSEYVPYLTSEDGVMPLVYTSRVRVEVVAP